MPNNEWISVEDRLPKRETAVLVSNTCSRAMMPEIVIARRECEGQCWESADGFTLNHVTHWMPLPEPPK